MNRPQASTMRLHWLAPLCLGLAFLQLAQQQVISQAAAGEQHGPQEAHVGGAPTGQMISMGSESSSALESSGAINTDDLIAAESSQASDAPAEHKSFTSGQVLRQEGPQQQMPASAAPMFVGPAQQQQPQHQPPAQQQQHHQPGPPSMFGVHPQHMAMQARHAQQKAFNPFMAAALAGNYGPAQQQIAAAAAAAAGLHGPHQQHHAHPMAAGLHPAQAQQHPVHVHQLASAHQPHHPHRQPAGGESAMAVQESAVRSNVVPAPGYGSMLDSNSIELSDAPQPAPQSSAMVSAASAQHPVVAAGSSQQDGAASAWPLQAPDIPKIVNLEVKCEKNLMKVSIEFDKVFNGVIFSKGHYSQGQCVHVSQNSGKQQAYFDISINSCGTQGNTQNGLYGMGGNTGSGTYFENTIVVQYDPNVQEVYDHARKLRCTWHDQYEKAVTFRPFPVDMLDIVRADFAGDNVGCWMQIQVGKGPWASEVAGIVKIGQTMTMVLAIKDEENKFDMLVRNCFAHDGKRGPIELVDKSGCITRPKLMSRFTKIKNFGSSATVLSYAHFQAFKFPDSMEVHFQCTIQICRHQCPEQCSSSGAGVLNGPNGESYSESTISGTFNIHGAQSGAGAQSDSLHLRKYGSSAASSALSRERRDLHRRRPAANGSQPLTKTVGLNRVIQVVSTGDLAFAIQQQQQVNGSFGEQLTDLQADQLTRVDLSSQICVSSYNFVLALVVLSLTLLCSCLLAISLYLRHRTLAGRSNKLLAGSSACPSPLAAGARHQTQPQPQQQHYGHHQHSPHQFGAAR